MSLASMFAQMNAVMNAGGQAKQGPGTPQGMLPRQADTMDPRLAKGFGAISNTLFGNGEAYETSVDALRGVQEQIGQLDLTSSEGLMQASQLYGQLGLVPQAMQMAEKAQAQAAVEANLKKEQAFRTNLADRADKQGMKDLAEAIRTGAHPDLETAAEEIRKDERQTLAMEKGKPFKRVLARQAGFTDAEIEEMGLLDAPDEEFFKIIDGEKGTIKAFQTAAGEDIMLATDEYGRVWYNGKRMRPEEVGLRQAPQKTQEVVSAANQLVQAATDVAADDFKQLHEAAKDSAKTIEVTDRALSRLDAGAATGFFAPIEIALGKVASELGIAPELASNAQNAEAYAATMGNEVATIIKDFGSGTGLSDADREYALRIAGGDVKVDEAVLRWLLNARRLAARNIRARHSEVLSALNEKGLDATAFQILNTTTTARPTVPTSELSEAAQAYF